MMKTKSKPHTTSCWICNTRIESSIKHSSKSNISSLEEKCVKTICTLRHVLKIPSALCEEFLQHHGNPSEWDVTMCTDCNKEFVIPVHQIQIQIQKLQLQLEDIQSTVQTQILQSNSNSAEETLGFENFGNSVHHKVIQHLKMDHSIFIKEETEDVDDNYSFSCDFDCHLPAEEEMEVDASQMSQDFKPTDLLQIKHSLDESELDNSLNVDPHMNSSSDEASRDSNTKNLKQTKKLISKSKEKTSNLNQMKPRKQSTRVASLKAIKKINKLKKKAILAEPTWSTSDTEWSGNDSDNSDIKPPFGTSDKYPCKLCRGVFFRDQIALDAHIREIHEGDENPYHCDKCPSHLETRTKLWKHMQTSHGERTPLGQPLRCATCRNKFPTQTALTKHTGKTKHRCPHCSISLCSLDGLRIHIKSLHPSIQSTQFKCDICEKVLISKEGFKHHMKNHTSASLDRPFCCQLCDKTFKYKKTLVDHERFIHSEALNLDPLKCPECSKVLASATSLKHHMVVAHTKSFRFSCPHCQKGYDNPREFKNHLKTHSDERPEICHICASAFKSHKGLYYHLQLHEERKYKCSLCPKTFTGSTKLKRHVQGVHSKEFNYECEFCQKKFAVKNYLYCHVRRCHNESTVGTNQQPMQCDPTV